MNNRVRIYYVNHDCLLGYLQSMSQWPQIICRTIINDIPDDAKVEQVHYDISRRCLSVLVSHHSFDEVPDGEIPPQGMNGYATVRRVAMHRQLDGSYGEACTITDKPSEQSWRDKPPLL